MDLQISDQYFTLNQKFSQLFSTYYETMMIMHMNILLINTNNNDNKDKNSIVNLDYYTKFTSKGVDINFPEYFFLESSFKLDEIASFINEIKLSIYWIGNGAIIEELSNKKIKYFYLQNSNENFNIAKKEILIFDAFENLLQQLKLSLRIRNLLHIFTLSIHTTVNLIFNISIQII